MTGDPQRPPRYHGVMVSSTVTDLAGHRARAMEAIESHGMHPVAQEQDGALPDGTVVSSSLRMVRSTSAYLVIVGRRYGQVPESAELNPDGLSLTELEYHEARRLGRPILALLMSDEHAVKPAAYEQDPEMARKLVRFREEVKRQSEGSSVHRVYTEFDDEDHFATQVSRSAATLRRHLDENDSAAPATSTSADAVPRAPALYAVPRYGVSQTFVGRAAQIDMLDTWASPSDPHPMLLFEAIGGTGKSMLTWEWATRRAGAARDDWAGTLWYSFYERGAVMVDFCRHALAYTTGRPLSDFARMRQPELSDLLMTELDAQPWLLVLDGLERVLVAYHRSDAAQLVDEEAGTSDEIADRHPCAAIRPEDGALLARLAGLARSKILVTSRLMPQVLLNRAGQPVPGVVLERLRGLRPEDAEELLLACGADGTSEAIRSYLQRHCDCHPLVIEIIGGLVADHLPARGSFDAWAADPDAGGRLDLGELDLVQKRNHILDAAMAALPQPGRRLLSTLALLPAAAEYDTLVALNPHLPDLVSAPERIDSETAHLLSSFADEAGRALHQASYDDARERHSQYLRTLRSAPMLQALKSTTLDLERRGLLQYDPSSRRYDLHPVVRGVAAADLEPDVRTELGRRVVDHFTARSPDPYELAETLDDLSDSLTVLRVQIRMGETRNAVRTYRGGLAHTLITNLEAHAETLAVVRAFLPAGWTVRPDDLTLDDYGYLTNAADLALSALGETDAAGKAAIASLRAGLADADWTSLFVSLINMAVGFAGDRRLAVATRCSDAALRIAEHLGDNELVFRALLRRFDQLTQLGNWLTAWAVWERADAMGRSWGSGYRQGSAELLRARYLYCRGRLSAADLDLAEELTTASRHRTGIRSVRRLRARWLLERGDDVEAADQSREAVAMAHAVGLRDVASEIVLVMARIRLGEIDDPVEEAHRLAQAPEPSHQGLCDLWRAVGQPDEAARHAIEAYRDAWADGEPYVRRFALDRARNALAELGVPVPDLPPYDPDRDPDPDWMADVVAAVEKLERGE